ncbi:transcription factor [Ganoderma sinense ZZ0214-1]|uniref:Transcription factor n=1 Tax=Ganoderma sinense ZZ0214-1 TaxID=1077348 RepID=A0A2G8S768_9APHY|nr:transcription factor [Ganoderma sinense ZZ0214-1]
MDVDKYDEYYASKPSREVITVETKIKSSNIGFSMLARMGWVEGTPLGASGDGRVDPVPFYVKNDLTGLGKASQDVRMIESTVSQRRGLDSERQTKETQEQRKQREDAVARRAAVQSEITTVLRPFYCEVCEKQFQNVAQYDEHTNSYAHHHKVRFRDMQLAQRASRNTEEEVSKRKEKERKREEKELRKIAKAAGVKMVKPPVAVAAAGEASSMPSAGSAAGGGFKKSEWATVVTFTADTSVTSPEPPKRSAWATLQPHA